MICGVRGHSLNRRYCCLVVWLQVHRQPFHITEVRGIFGDTKAHKLVYLTGRGLHSCCYHRTLWRESQVSFFLNFFIQLKKIAANFSWVFERLKNKFSFHVNSFQFHSYSLNIKIFRKTIFKNWLWNRCPIIRNDKNAGVKDIKLWKIFYCRKKLIYFKKEGIFGPRQTLLWTEPEVPIVHSFSSKTIWWYRTGESQSQEILKSQQVPSHLQTNQFSSITLVWKPRIKYNIQGKNDSLRKSQLVFSSKEPLISRKYAWIRCGL